MEHTLIICTKQEYEKWKNKKLVLNEWTGKFYPRDAALAEIVQLGCQQPLLHIDDGKFDYIGYNKYFHSKDFYNYYGFYTSPNGDEYVAFGKYKKENKNEHLSIITKIRKQFSRNCRKKI